MGDTGETMYLRVNSPMTTRDGSDAMVSFQVAGEIAGDGSLYGLLHAFLVRDDAGRSGWVVGAVRIGTADAGNLVLDGGTFTGDVSGSAVGAHQVTVRDARTGELLASADAEGAVEFDGIGTDAVLVQMWNPGGEVTGDVPEFLEALVRRGDAPVDDIFGEQIDTEYRGPFSGDPVSVFERLGEDGTQQIVDGDAFRISVSGGSDLNMGSGGPEPYSQYCIEVAGGGAGYSLCAAADDGSSSVTLSMFGNSGRDGAGLIVAVVPDTVASVTDLAGREVPLVDNVFYDTVTPGVFSYLLESADGSRQQVMTFSYLAVGAEPTMG